jgi:hypothetical protein
MHIKRGHVLACSSLGLAIGGFVACSADQGDTTKAEGAPFSSGPTDTATPDEASGSTGSTGTTGSTGSTATSGSTSTGSSGTYGGSTGAGLDGSDASVADSSLVEDATVPEDASVEDAFAGDIAVVEAGNDAGMDASDGSVSDASSGGGDAAVCGTMWPDGGTNLVTNPTFESTASGWSTQFGGGTYNVSSTTAHCGTHSGEISSRTAYYDALSTSISTTAGTYTVALWILQDGTSSLQMTIQGYGTCGTAQFINLGPSAATGFPTIGPNTWTFVSGTLTVPTGCTAMSLIIEQDGAQSALPDLFVDDVFVGQ